MTTGTLNVLDRTGDTKVMWDKDNPDEVKAAKRTFDDLVKNKKYLAYSVKGKKGEPGEQMKEFDPNAERVILSKQLVGG